MNAEIPKEGCTCKNQSLPWGSYYCKKDALCRKDKDKDWWEHTSKKKENFK